MFLLCLVWFWWEPDLMMQISIIVLQNGRFWEEDIQNPLSGPKMIAKCTLRHVPSVNLSTVAYCSAHLFQSEVTVSNEGGEVSTILPLAIELVAPSSLA